MGEAADRILIVEDDPEIAKVVAMNLADIGLNQCVPNTHCVFPLIRFRSPFRIPKRKIQIGHARRIDGARHRLA